MGEWTERVDSPECAEEGEVGMERGVKVELPVGV